MPLGNDNLLRGNARWRLESKVKGGVLEVGWQAPPEDQSSNAVEIWSGPQTWPPGEALPDMHPFLLTYTPPGEQRPRTWHGTHGKTKKIMDKGKMIGRIYCERVSEPTGKNPERIRFRYAVFTLRTAHARGDAPLGKAGLWTLKISNETPWETECYVSVQVDQAPEPYGVTNRRSYFQHRKYEKHIGNGRSRDSYGYPFVSDWESNQEKANEVGPMQRKGTNNALANLAKRVAVVGGYRVRDGKPADYSATTYGVRTPGGMAEPTAALPTEDGPFHFGVMSAGSKSGSTTAMRGTSCASALATRIVSQDLLLWHDSKSKALGSVETVKEWAETQDAPTRFPAGQAAQLKVGAGRIVVPPLRNPSRTVP